jgi:hypothetical protein
MAKPFHWFVGQSALQLGVFWIAVLVSLGLTISIASDASQLFQECSIEITLPKAGAQVRRDALVSGTAKIPASAHLWVLAHKKGLKGWWPQGGGEADISDGNWEVLVIFGKPNTGEIGTFEVAAVAVDKATNEDLKRWVEEAPRKDYQPINFPNPIEGCPFKRVTVEKAGD